MLHDPADQHLAGAITQRVDIDLDGVFEEAVDERGPLHRESTLASEAPLRCQLGHRRVERFGVVDDLHRAATEHVRRPNQHGIADLLGDVLGSRRRRGGPARSLGNAESRAELIELLAVLCQVDRGWARPEHGDAGALERVGELQGRLTAKRHDDADERCAVAGERVTHICARLLR